MHAASTHLQSDRVILGSAADGSAARHSFQRYLYLTWRPTRAAAVRPLGFCHGPEQKVDMKQGTPTLTLPPRIFHVTSFLTPHRSILPSTIPKHHDKEPPELIPTRDIPMCHGV